MSNPISMRNRLRAALAGLEWIDPSVRSFLMELTETELLGWQIELLLTDFIPFQTRQWEYDFAQEGRWSGKSSAELPPALKSFLTLPDSADDLIQ